MELINEIMVSLIVVVTFLSSGTQKHWRRISGTPNQFFLLPSLLLSVARKISTIASQTKHFLRSRNVIDAHSDIYSGGRMKFNKQILSQTFWLFWPPSRENPETNDISFESPNIQLLESEIKLGVASSWWLPRPLKWKSTTFTKIGLTPPRTELLPISLQISVATSQGFQKRYITFS